jgi:timeless
LHLSVAASSETSRQSATLHQELISLFDRELVLEILLVLGQEMESRENAQYNLLMMELLSLLLKSQDPIAVARSFKKKKTPDQTSAASRPQGALTAKIQQERTKIQSLAGARHAHFGGTWMTKRLDGKQSYFGAQTQTKSSTAVAKRKNRKAEPFIGSSRGSLMHSRLGTSIEDGPATQRAQQTLHTFCTRFVENCYGPVMKSLKNEFRRDSHRLEDGDKVVFFRITWFFCQWWRQVRAKGVALGQLIFTMDVFTFNLVLNATDSFFERKKHARLAQTVALYSEMMHLLHDMHVSKESTERIMAMGLMDKLFYANEPLDRLPKLLQRWAPSISTREYLCDLSELCYVSLKLLDANAKACRDFEKPKVMDAVAKMTASAAEFEVMPYFTRKLVSNQVVIMFTHLLNQYTDNSPNVNHRIIALFLRLSRVQIAAPDADAQDEDSPQNLLQTKTVTVEPMLYNIQLLLVLDRILNDTAIRKEKDYASLLTFATNLMHNFATASKENPLLFVECLFRHGTPQKFCDLSTNFYVNDELRLIAERELLLEWDERRQREDAMEEREENDDDDDEEELEFTGDTDKPEGETSNASKSRVAMDSDDSDAEEPEAPVEMDKAKSSKENSTSSQSGEEGNATKSRVAVDSDDSDAEEPEAPVEKDKTKSSKEDSTSSQSGEEGNATKSRVAVDSDDSDAEEPEPEPEASVEMDKAKSSKEDSTSSQSGEEGDSDEAAAAGNDSAKRTTDQITENDAADSDAAPPPAKHQRLNKSSVDDADSSDDDVDFGGTSEMKDAPPAAKSTGRFVIDDDDD